MNISKAFENLRRALSANRTQAQLEAQYSDQKNRELSFLNRFTAFGALTGAAIAKHLGLPKEETNFNIFGSALIFRFFGGFREHYIESARMLDIYEVLANGNKTQIKALEAGLNSGQPTDGWAPYLQSWNLFNIEESLPCHSYPITFRAGMEVALDGDEEKITAIKNVIKLVK